MNRAPLALFAAAVFGACRGTDGAPSGDESVAAVVGARTAVVGVQPFTETLIAIGTVVARSGHLATLSVSAPGRVTRVLVTPGQRVASGQPLVSLDPSVFAAGARSAEAAVTAAQRNAERTQRLVTEGISPRKDAEQAVAELARTRADLVAAQRQAQLTTLRAPIAGVVTRLVATVGAIADPTQPLVEIADPSALDVLFTTAPADAGRILPGAVVTLLAGEGANGQPIGVGRVANIGAAVDTATRGVPVRVPLPAAHGQLRLGETVLGRIEIVSRAAALVVPAEALVPEGDGFKVFVVDAKGTAHARAVRMGARTDSLVEITKGLAGGERVVTYGAYGVTENARVVSAAQEQP